MEDRFEHDRFRDDQAHRFSIPCRRQWATPTTHMRIIPNNIARLGEKKENLGATKQIPPVPAMQLFTHDQLSAAAHNLGGDVRFARDLPGDQPVMSSAQAVQTLDNGLVLYLSRPRPGRCPQRPPAGARHHGRLPPRRQRRAGAGPPPPAPRRARLGGQCAMLANLTEADRFRRHWQAGRQETKVCTDFSLAWLEHFAGDPAQCGRRLQQFRPRALAVPALAAVGGHPATRPPAGRGQRRQPADPAHAAQASPSNWPATSSPASRPAHGGRPPKRLSPHLQHCLERLRGWLDGGEADHLSIAQMARELGTNPVDLQNGFRQRHGTTIAYLRRCRLARAHRGAQRTRLSVEDAASLAGYEHISSFSAAFRREFGLPPSRLNKP